MSRRRVGPFSTLRYNPGDETKEPGVAFPDAHGDDLAGVDSSVIPRSRAQEQLLHVADGEDDPLGVVGWPVEGSEADGFLERADRVAMELVELPVFRGAYGTGDGALGEAHAPPVVPERFQNDPSRRGGPASDGPARIPMNPEAL